MKLQTKIPIEKEKYNQIDYNSNVVLLGSCFAENVGEKFDYFKFKSAVNPFGILFHPLAIESLITRAINSDYYETSEVQAVNEHYVCYDAHSRMNTTEPSDLVLKLNSALDQTLEQLQDATHVIITLGTSWVYRHIANDAIVANCHKVPQKEFLKELLSVDEIKASLQAIVSLVRAINSKLSFIFTVSPIRHIKDGFVENTLSKSHLVSAIHQVVDIRHQLYYFPSYEIMMDELRDYRFYKDDMVHPSKQAIDYIWERFVDCWVTEDTLPTMKEIDAIQKGLSHRSSKVEGLENVKFQKQLLSKIESITAKFPHIIFN
ncbi:GSCFA domain-containing protein [Winogradskyella sp. A3E31]|uniref:GSCFA domain-containing protein n=1 Tax=Winogradskyella sp. A3E31 TaxID=3349637 RepID=UPI00398AE504